MGEKNIAYNEMLKRQKRQRRSKGKHRLRKSHTNWFSAAEEMYGDQRMAQELARANRGVYSFGQGQTLNMPMQRDDPWMSQAFVEGRSWGSLPGADKGYRKAQERRGAAGLPAAQPAAQQAGQIGRQPAKPQPITQFRGDYDDIGYVHNLFYGAPEPVGRSLPPPTQPMRQPRVTGRDRVQQARQGATFLGPQQPRAAQPGPALPEAARVTGPAREFMQIPQDIRRMQASQRVLMPEQPGVVTMAPRETGQERAQQARRGATFLQPEQEITPQLPVPYGDYTLRDRDFFRSHPSDLDFYTALPASRYLDDNPEVAQALAIDDTSGLTDEQIAALVYLGLYEYPTPAAVPTGTLPPSASRYSYGRGGRRGTTSSYGYPTTRRSYSPATSYGRAAYIGLTKWRI